MAFPEPEQSSPFVILVQLKRAMIICAVLLRSELIFKRSRLMDIGALEKCCGR